MRKEELVVLFKMSKPVSKLRNKFLGRLAAHFHRLRYIDVITYIRISIKSMELESVNAP